ncbi:MAG: hypothetical protein N3D82_01800 [Ignisphaera sp.]|nr:hypothetical protein [Ignisphaera sp.]MCX8167753.1 hypothetical protein [Ignisphaera sp.]MDW8085260.1 hypothetical protein [Ignisphaera sp.]
MSAIYSELFDEIKGIPVVDVHQHLNPASLSAKSIDDIVFYHYIVTELVSSGMPRRLIEECKGIDRLKVAVNYIKYIRNTSTFWCLKSILRDLYGFDLKSLEPDGVEEMVNVVKQKFNDEAWAKHILKNKVPVEKSFLTLNPLEKPVQHDRDLFTGALRMDPLLPNLTYSNLRRLEEITSLEIMNSSTLEEAVTTLLRGFAGSIVAVTINVQPDDEFISLSISRSDKSTVDTYLSVLRSQGSLDPLAKNTISSYILRVVLEFCENQKLAVQFMLGVKRPVAGASPPDYAITLFNPNQILNLARLFSAYPAVKFDVFIADMLLNHPITVIAKNYPNVYLSGYWWYAMYPEIIRSYLRLRLQMLPYNKIGGFFSDAYVADWVYGKAVLVKSQLAHVLAEFVKEGFMDRGTALEVAKALLSSNAKFLYNLM